MTKTQLFLRLLLALHLTGLVLMAGTTFIDFLTFKTFCKLSDRGDVRALGLLPLMSRYGPLVRAGAGILILSGIGMLALSKDIWQQPWFKIKLILVLALILHGMLVGSQQAEKFRTLASQNHPISTLKANLDRFYLLQLTLFFIIIIVSAIKFK